VKSLTPGRFFGSIRTREDHPGFSITHLRHERGARLPVHSHERAYFCLVRSGGYAESFGGTQVTYSARSVLFHPPGITHRDEIAPGGASFLIVEIGDELWRHAREHAPLGGSRQDLRGGELAHAAWRLDRECTDRGSASALVIEGLVLEMLGILARPGRGSGGHEPPWLAAVVERLHARPGESVTLRALASEVGVHPTRLSRGFRRRLGMGVGEYVRAMRVRWVEERLDDPDAELADLAVAAGFVDQSHMTRVFRRITGRTPGAARGTRVERE
jgi:AraC family transcriptional regulator